MKNRLLVLVPILIIFAGSLLFFAIAPTPKKSLDHSHRPLKVLAYASFISSWGPGPWIAQEFEKRTGIPIDFQDGGDAGLLLAKLKLFPSDVVVGFNQLSLAEARAQTPWQTVAAPHGTEVKWTQPDFVPFDWAPLSFIYRKAGGPRPPTSLDDLLEPRFAHALSLEDPRTSAPGLIFLYWVLDVKGVEPGFAYLQKLRSSVARVSPSWSTAYGFFTKKQAALAYSYFTSPVYHELNENDAGFSAAVFSEGLPVEVEYAGSPASCQSCEDAKTFLAFLLEPAVQKKIMNVNAMFPVVDELKEGTVFAHLPKFEVHEFQNLKTLQAGRQDLFQRWQSLGL